MLKMAQYEPLDAIIDVPAVQEARSGESSREECKTASMYMYMYVLHVRLVHEAHIHVE